MPTKKRAPAKKKVGRPTELDQKDLLDAAEKLFAEKGFEGTTTRELAKRAGCNVALISYHFGSKDGLYQAVLVRHFEELRARYAHLETSDEVLAKAWPELQTSSERVFCASIYELTRNISSSALVRKIICREMMTGGAKMMAAMSKSESGAYSLLKKRIEALQTSGALSPDMDVKLTIVSLIGPVIYSCIAKPILTHVYGFKALDEAYFRALCVHQTRTVFAGWGRNAQVNPRA